MKRILAIFLVLLMSASNLAFSAENWVFTAPGSNNSTYYNNTYAQPVESNRPYQAYSSDDAYYGTVTTNVIPREQEYTYNTQTTSNNTEYKPQKASFSDRHPILTGLGIGALVLGAAAFTLLSDDDDDYRNDRDRRPPPPPRDRDNSHHHNHQHHSHNR